jgi:hypothetical protein
MDRDDDTFSLSFTRSTGVGWEPAGSTDTGADQKPTESTDTGTDRIAEEDVLEWWVMQILAGHRSVLGLEIADQRRWRDARG